MTRDEASKLLEAELNRLHGFTNFHGITKENVRDFVVLPYRVRVDPDDLETSERDMWVVLNLAKEALIAIDPLTKNLSLLHSLPSGQYVQVITGAVLSEVLDGM